MKICFDHHYHQVSFIIFYISIIITMEPFVTMRGGQNYTHYVGIIMMILIIILPAMLDSMFSIWLNHNLYDALLQCWCWLKSLFLHIDTDAIVINNILLAVAMQVHTGAAGME